MTTKRFYILAIRSASSVLGPSSAIAKANGQVVSFATHEEAQKTADEWNAKTSSPNVRYTVLE